MQESTISIRTRKRRLTLVGAMACCALAQAVTPMVSVGDSHALALRSDGTVLAWGSDTYGQLGLGRALMSSLPVRVSGLSGVKAIAGGQHHSLAVRQDGTVWAWGANDHGQLGDGTSLNRSRPTLVPGVANAVMACGGSWHSAILRQDGTVWTWGTNTSGQLGNGVAGGEWWSTSPAPVTGLTTATSIACAGEQTFALLKDGTVRAWGANPSGQLGDGSTTIRALPVPVSGLTHVIAINGAAALKQDGTVWEWGFESCCGQSTPNLVPVPSAGVRNAIALGTSLVTIFGSHLDAIGADGTTWWEWSRGLPPVSQEAVGQLTAIASAPYNTLLLKGDGTVLAAGLNNLGQLGNGMEPPTYWFLSPPTPVLGLTHVVALGIGEAHGLALDASGDVWAWGNDASGQLGRGGTLSSTLPVVVPNLHNIVQVSVGWEYSLAVDAEGFVWAWGNNYYGQVGDGTSSGDGANSNRSSPVRLSGIGDVRAVAAGAGNFAPTSLALKRDGSVWAWGNNWDGQLGNGTAAHWSATPAPVPGLTQIAGISSSAHQLAVKQDGTVWAWGANSNGQLGIGTTTASAIPVQVPGLTSISGVTAAGAASFAVGGDGSVVAWGSGVNDILGDGTWSDFNQSTPKPVPGLTKVVEVARGFAHALARRTDGSVWAWGMGFGSQIGGLQSGALAAPITNLAPMQNIAAGGGSTALLGTDGLLYMGGTNALGQLGDGTFAEHPEFVLALDPSGTTFLNLAKAGASAIPPALQIPFFVSSIGGISGSSASVSTTTKFNPADSGKSGTVFITASVPTDSALALSARSANAAIGPHPNKAAGTTAPAFTLLQLTPSGWQTVTNGQFISYASGVLGDKLAAQTILNGTDTSSLKGAEFCVGYGTSAADMLANGNIRAVATVPGATTPTSCVVGGTLSVALSVAAGWNLLGNPVNQSIAVAAKFGDAAKVSSVWKWDSTAAKWQFYTPGLSAAELQSYAATQGYTVLSEISPGDGFWVNAKAQADLGTLSGAAINLRQSSLSAGWNLVSTASAITPQDFNLSLSTTPPTAGQAPINLTSLWAWDSAQSQWYFYAPRLEAGALTQYIADQGYRDFGSNAKTLGNGVGFWVRRP